MGRLSSGLEDSKYQKIQGLDISKDNPRILTEQYERDSEYFLKSNKIAPLDALSENRQALVYVFADNLDEAHRKIAEMQNKDVLAGKTPEGPYVSSTKAWTDLSLRRALAEAIENGQERLGVSPDEVHTARWGRDFGYYDNIVRKRLDALAKKYKSKSGFDYLDAYVSDPSERGKVMKQGYHYLEINDKMRDAYEEGVPLFSTRKPPLKLLQISQKNRLIMRPVQARPENFGSKTQPGLPGKSLWSGRI